MWYEIYGEISETNVNILLGKAISLKDALDIMYNEYMNRNIRYNYIRIYEQDKMLCRLELKC